MSRVGFVLWLSLGSFPLAGLAWVLMWVTDRLYDWGIWWLGAVVRIIVVIMQVGVLLACLVTAAGIAWFSFDVFYRASQGRDTNEEGGMLSVKRYMTLLVLPAAMVLASVLVGLFHNWLNFNEHGLGFISWGYIALHRVLQIGSLVVLGVWLTILPIFLHRHRALSLAVTGVGGVMGVQNHEVLQAKRKTTALGVSSLVFGIIGIFWWSAVMGIIAIILGIMQLALQRSTLAVAGLTVGVVDILLAVFWYKVGLMPSVF